MVKLSMSAVWVIGARNQPNGMDLAVERLGSAIRLGVFGVDTRLPAERELASIIGVSRATLREAIRLLAAQGSLEAHRGRGGGTFVVRAPHPPTITEVTAELAMRGTSLTEILDQRWAVETAIAELAARRATKAQLERMKALLPLMEAAHGHTETYRRHDIEFHLLLGEAALSTRLGELLAESHRELAGLMSAVPHSSEIRRSSSDQHRRLV
ncbi:MAG: GntR family transcriptional regulator, partial [Acidimicrobiia bacterium]|nr:GntR family transcriptional regulator [Acidimicrobiia bacterium]